MALNSVARGDVVDVDRERRAGREQPERRRVRGVVELHRVRGAAVVDAHADRRRSGPFQPARIERASIASLYVKITRVAGVELVVDAAVGALDVGAGRARVVDVGAHDAPTWTGCRGCPGRSPGCRRRRRGGPRRSSCRSRARRRRCRCVIQVLAPARLYWIVTPAAATPVASVAVALIVVGAAEHPRARDGQRRAGVVDDARGDGGGGAGVARRVDRDRRAGRRRRRRPPSCPTSRRTATAASASVQAVLHVLPALGLYSKRIEARPEFASVPVPLSVTEPRSGRAGVRDRGRARDRVVDLAGGDHRPRSSPCRRRRSRSRAGRRCRSAGVGPAARERRARAGAGRRPGAGRARAVLVEHRGDAAARAVAASSRQRDGAAERRAGVGERDRGRGVVDDPVGGRRARRVAGAVGRGGAHVPGAVGDGGRVPACRSRAALPSLQIGVQLPPEDGRASKATEITPLPPSVAVALTVAVPVSGVGGGDRRGGRGVVDAARGDRAGAASSPTRRARRRAGRRGRRRRRCVSNEHVYGRGGRRRRSSVQVPAPAGERWKVTDDDARGRTSRSPTARRCRAAACPGRSARRRRC